MASARHNETLPQHASGSLNGTRQTSIIIRMISDLDTYRSANVLVKHHGQDAPIHAAMQADALLDKGVLGGYGVWRRILRAVEELQRTEPEPGEEVH